MAVRGLPGLGHGGREGGRGALLRGALPVAPALSACVSYLVSGCNSLKEGNERISHSEFSSQELNFIPYCRTK